MAATFASLGRGSSLPRSTTPSSTSLRVRKPARSPSPSPSVSPSFSPNPKPEEYVIALHAYTPPQGMTTCISFQAGDIILVHTKDSGGWWDGSLGSGPDEGKGKRGWFPSNYVSGMDPPVWGDRASWAGSSSASKSARHVHLRSCTVCESADANPAVPLNTFTRSDPNLHLRTSRTQARHALPSSFLTQPLPPPPKPKHSPQSSISTAAGSDLSRARSQTSFTSSAPSAHSHSRPTLSSLSLSPSSPAPSPAALSPSSRPGTLDAVQKSVLLLTRAARSGRKAHYGSAAACVISSVRTVLTAAECLSRSSGQLERWPELRERRKEVLGLLSGVVKRAKLLGPPQPPSAAQDKDAPEELNNQELDPETEKKELEKMLELAEEVVLRLRALVDTALKCGIDVPGAEAAGSAEQDMPTPVPASEPLHPPSPAPVPSPIPAPTIPRTVETDIEGHVRAPVKPRVQAAIAAHRARSLADLRAKRAREEPEPKEELSKSEGPGPALRKRGRGGSESSSGGHQSSQSGSMASLSSVASARDPAAQLALASSTGSGGSITLTPGEMTMLLKHTQDASVSLFAALIGHVQTYSSHGHAASHARLVEVAAGAVGKLREAMWIVDAVANHLAGKGRDKGVERLVNARRGLWRLAGEVVDAAAGLTRESTPSPEGESAAEEEKKERLTKRGFEALRAVGDCVVAVKMGLAGVGPAEGVRLEELAPVEAFIQGGVVSALPGRDGPGSSIGPGGRPGTASGRGKDTLDALAIKAARLLSLREEYLDEDEEEEEEEHGQTPVPDFLNQDTLRPKQLQKDVVSSALSGAATEPEPELEGSQSPTSSVPTITHSHSQSLSLSIHPPAPLRIITGFGIAPSHGPISPESGRLSEDALNDLNIPLRSPTAFIDPARHQLQLPLMPSFTSSVEDTLESGDLAFQPQPKLSPGHVNDWIIKDDDEPADVLLNPDETVIGGTLPALVKRMTPHVVTPELSFSSSFFMTFRLFTTPLDLADCLVKRWDVKLPTAPGGRAMTKIEMQVWHDRMLVPIRLRILNFVKNWLESHWQAGTDAPALVHLQFFVDQVPDGILKAASRKIGDLISTRRLRPESIHNKYAAVTISQATAPRSLDRTKSFDRMRSATPLPFGNGAASYASANPPPAPMVGRSLYSTLRAGTFSAINVTDFDPLELARQLSVMENKLYIAIQPQELLQLGKSGAPPAVNVKAITTLSTAITGLVTESVLSEYDIKKRTNLLKYYIKVAERALELKNFSLLFSILAALTSSTVLRLNKTWAGLNSKYRTKLEELRKVTDYTRNYGEYRSRLRETEPAAIPFLGVYLTDITFCNGGNPSHRPSPVRSDVQLINFNKYRKLARIVFDMQRFQKAYNLLEINEAQHFLQFALRESRTSGDHKDLYRRSLLIEPRESSAEPASADTVKSRTDIFGWAARSLGQTNTANTVAA